MSVFTPELQQLYVVFFGRPADSGGIAFFDQQRENGISLTAIAQAFSNAPETQLRYAGASHADVVGAFYQNAFGHAPTAERLAYWSAQLDNHTLDSGRVALGILAEAQGSDLVALANKGAAAQSFTAALLTPDQSQSYSGDAANAQARPWLAAVGSNAASLATAHATLDTTLTLAVNAGKGIFTLSGTVVDGYVSGATVFADANGNGRWDAGEARTVTDTLGHYALERAIGPIVATGGIDVSTGAQVAGTLSAPAGYSQVSPITTLVHAIATSEAISPAAAEVLFKAKLGIAPGVDLSHYDPIVEATRDGASGAAIGTAIKVMAVATQVNTLIGQVGAVLSGVGVSDDKLAGANAANVALAKLIVDSDAGLDLAHSSVAATVLQSAAADEGASVAQASVVQALASDAGQAIANLNQAIGQVSADSGRDALIDIAKIQFVAESVKTATEIGAATSNLSAATQSTMPTELASATDDAAFHIGDVDGDTTSDAVEPPDLTAPQVSSVATSTDNGHYKAGASIAIAVHFDEAVVVSTTNGTPSLLLETGTVDHSAVYASGSGTDTLVFNYLVQAGDNSGDLDVASAAALVLNGGSITDQADNAASLAVAAPAASGSLGANANIDIDTLAPTVTAVSASTSDGAYKAGDTVSIQVSFSETVNVATGTPTLLLDTGSTDHNASYASGSGTNTLTFSYVVQAGDTAGDLDYQSTAALALGGATLRDAAGNDATLALATPGAAGSLANGKAIVIDTTAPTVTSVGASTANATYKAGDTVSIDVGFSEAVTVAGGTPTLLLETGGSDHSATYASGSGTNTLTFNYIVQAGDNTTDLDYQSTAALALNGATLRDAVGNEGTLTLATPGAVNSLANNKAIVIDTVAPTVSGVNASTSNGSYKAGDTVSIQVNFSEAVNVAGGAPTLLLETGGIDRNASYASGSGSNTLTFNYVVQAGDTASDLDYQSTAALALGGATLRDGVGNDATLALATPGAATSLASNKAIVIDTAAPTVTGVDASTSNGSYKAGVTVSIQVSFSEAVNVAGGTPTLQLETGSTDRNANYTGGSGTNTLTFNYVIQAGDTAADLDYQSATALVLNGATLRDAVGNDGTLTLPTPGGAASLANNKAIIVDTTAPIVEGVTSSTSDGSYKTGDTASIQVSFSEAVTVAGGTPTLLLETGSTDHSATYASGSGTSTLTFSYVVQAGDNASDLDYQSTAALALAGSTIRDAAGNDGTLTLATPGAANSLANSKAIVIDTTAPTVTGVDSTTSNGGYKAGDTVSIQVSFSEAVTVNGGTPTLLLETGSIDHNATY
ncbi:MAG: hypothetical protein V4463_23680, partial [Pseudomonadota bacterium]